MKKRDIIEKALVKRIRNEIERLVLEAEVDAKTVMNMIKTNISTFNQEEYNLTYNYARYIEYLKNKKLSTHDSWDKYLRKLDLEEIETIDEIEARRNPEISKEMLEQRRLDSNKYDEISKLLRGSVQTQDESEDESTMEFIEDNNVTYIDPETGEETLVGGYTVEGRTEFTTLQDDEDEKTIIDLLNEERDSLGEFEPTIDEEVMYDFDYNEDHDFTLSFDEKENMFGDQFGLKIELEDEEPITEGKVEEQKEVLTTSKNYDSEIEEIKNNQEKIISLLNEHLNNDEHKNIIDTQNKIIEILNGINNSDVISKQEVMEQQIIELTNIVKDMSEKLSEWELVDSSPIVEQDSNKTELEKQTNIVNESIEADKNFGTPVSNPEHVDYEPTVQATIHEHNINSYKDNESVIDMLEKDLDSTDSEVKDFGTPVSNPEHVDYEPTIQATIHEHNVDAYEDEEPEIDEESTMFFNPQGIDQLWLGEEVLYKGKTYMIIGAEEKENNDRTISKILKLENTETEEILFVDSKKVDYKD